MEHIIQVRVPDEAHAAHIAQVFANLSSSGNVKYEGSVLEKVENGLYNIILRGGKEDDRETETVR